MIRRIRRLLRVGRFGIGGALLGFACGIPLAAVGQVFDGQEAVFWLSAAASAVAFAYAVASLGWRHPAEDHAYGSWLQSSPWEPSQPLPFDSPFLSLNDLAFLLTLSLCGPAGFLSTFFATGLAFTLGYVGRLANSTTQHDEPLLPAVLSILAGLVPLACVGGNGPIGLSVAIGAVVALAASQLSVRRVLNRLNEIVLTPGWLRLHLPETRLLAIQQYGSPAAQLLHEIDDETERAGSRWATVAWIGYFTICCEAFRRLATAWSNTIDSERLHEFATTPPSLESAAYFAVEGLRLVYEQAGYWPLVIGLGLAPGPLLLLACTGTADHQAPISLLGRLATGRLIIPRYDVVWLGPCALALVYVVSAAACLALTRSPVLAAGCGFCAAVLSYNRLVPRLVDWRLTGHHRIVCRNPPMRAKR